MQQAITYRLIAIAVTGAIALFYLKQSLQALEGNFNNYWAYSELFVNYEGGFVRRGLIGEILTQLWTLFGVNPKWPIWGAFLIASWILVFSFSSLVFQSTPSRMIYSLVMLCPLTLTFPLRDYLSFLRKEMFTLALLSALTLWALRLCQRTESPSRNTVVLFIALSSLALSISILIWEPSGFICLFYVSLAYKVHASRAVGSSWGALVGIWQVGAPLLLLPGVLFLLSILNSGSPERSTRNWNSVADWSGASQLAIDAHGWTLETSNTITFREILVSPASMGYYLTALVMGPLLLTVLLALGKSFRSLVSTWLCAAPLMVLFLIGVDYGRWLFILTVCVVSHLAFELALTNSQHSSGHETKIAPGLATLLGIVVVVVYATSWQVPHAGAQAWTAFVQLPHSWLYATRELLPFSG